MDNRTNRMAELTTHEMARAQGGAQVDYFLKLHGVDGEATATDDVWVDGKIITAQNFNSAR